MAFLVYPHGTVTICRPSVAKAQGLEPEGAVAAKDGGDLRALVMGRIERMADDDDDDDDDYDDNDGDEP